VIAHPSFQAADELGAMSDERLAETDLVVTSYGTLLRQSWIDQACWRLVVLDEAQAIKNPNAKQTRAVKSLRAKARIVLTGTPIENNLRDLWSIFDFVNPGLLGSAKAFAQFAKTLASQPHISYAPLRRLVRPYILRRLKTDKSIIADLPDKTEVKAFCHLTRKQAALYQAAVAELEENLKQSGDGIARRGLVLSSLMRLKQICNHPSQWLGDGAYDESDSGKFERLREIGEAVASRQEKLLVFTQFKEIIPSLGGCSRRRSRGQGSSFMATRRSPNAATSSRRFRKTSARRFSSSRSRLAAQGSILPAPRMWFISIAGGILRSRTRRPIALIALAKGAMCSCTNSSAGERSRRRSTC
jgi:SNF2 family DNA or RNA helicase